jgi:NADPH-dependent 2,4-dienoyl-CoA reductase/sulfur reductase-like enzyme
MRDYKYLIIGGGMAADAAVSGIRESDADGDIGIISSDSEAPYDRPPLTKSLWKDKPIDSVWRHTENRGADLRLGRAAVGIDVDRKTIVDDRGERYTFDKLLLATGGSPRRLRIGADEDIIYYRTLADYRRLREMTEQGERFAVIGGGFIGAELAAALSMNHKEVAMIFAGSGICSSLFPRDLSQFLHGFYRQKGVDVWCGESVVNLERRGRHLVLRSESLREFVVDGVVAGIGIEPNVDLARMAGLRIAGGIVVNEFLRTSQGDIYAAGDVAAFYSPALGRRLRVEHEDNANTMGRIAGRNMAGRAEPYHHLPFFYSDLFELGYEAVGEVDSRLTAIEDWKEPYREGVVYYQRDNLVRGVLLWNIWGQVDAARELIAEKRACRAEDLKQMLPKVA